MSFLDNFPRVSDAISSMKEFVFGENNSRLDTLLDYFFSVRQEKRSKIVFYTVISVVILFILVLSTYFLGLYKLQKSLNAAVNHVQELNKLEPDYSMINQEFIKLTENLRKNNQPLEIVSILEQKTRDMGIETAQFPEKPPLIDLQNRDPLFNQFQKIKIEYNLPNISLRKIIDYVNAVQQMENHFKVIKLNIQQKFGTKLYFDVSIAVEAYVPSQKNPE